MSLELWAWTLKGYCLHCPTSLIRPLGSFQGIHCLKYLKLHNQHSALKYTCHNFCWNIYDITFVLGSDMWASSVFGRLFKRERMWTLSLSRSTLALSLEVIFPRHSNEFLILINTTWEKVDWLTYERMLTLDLVIAQLPDCRFKIKGSATEKCFAKQFSKHPFRDFAVFNWMPILHTLILSFIRNLKSLSCGE